MAMNSVPSMSRAPTHFFPRPLATFAVAVLLGLFAIAQTTHAEGDATGSVITGTLTYLQRIALPPDAMVTVSLQDISLADARAKTLAEQKFPTAGKQVPIAFSLPFNPADIDPARTYTLRATISSGGRLLFASNMSNRVLTRGAGTQRDVVLQQIAGGAGSTASAPGTSSAGGTATLVNTYWKLTELGGAPAAVLPDQREAHFILTADGARIAGTGGCNRLTGTYESGPDSALKLKVGGMTMMACEEPLMTQEGRFVEALNATTTYRIDGEKLELRKGDQVLARFESRYLK